MRLLMLAILILVGLSAPAVVLTREPLKQCIAVSFYGLLLAVLFFVFQAPDVALSQITVGAVILPAIILLALVKMRRHNQLRKREGGVQ
jgi:energy-converting hydrogenase B subunit D